MDDGHNPDSDGSQKIRDVYAVKLDLTHSHRHHCPAAMAERPHLFPCRTQQLSSPAPMVVGLTSRKSRTLPGSDILIEYLLTGELAQLGEHLPYKQRVGGSNPSFSTIHKAGLAQLVEQLTCNQ